MFSCLFQALSMKHDPTRSLSSRTVKNWTWFSSNWMMSKWCGSALLLEAACGGDPAGISNMILDCMITGPVFWGPVAGYRAAESGWLFF
jgi:hypothetical protein